VALKIEDMFNSQGKEKMLSRINALTSNSKPLWGKMNVGQMLAHCNVAYEIVHEPGKHSPPGRIDKFFARVFAKGTVVGDKPYAQSGPTAPMFIIKDSRDAEKEKARLISYINKTFQQGAAHYDGLENMTFGKLSSREWNTLFSKHLDHHLRQFGV
jgi:Protein of unknown function (DUF1569)